MKKILFAVMAVLALSLLGCKDDPPESSEKGDGVEDGYTDESSEPSGNEGELDLIDYHYTKAAIEAEIDTTWETLKTEDDSSAYSGKPDKYIAISFDDGPTGGATASSGNKSTQDLLDILEAKKVKATFFLIGQNIRTRKDAATAIFNAGHELANHSDGYADLGGAAKKEDDIEKSLKAANAAIKEITGHNARFFRAPNVSYGTPLSNVCKNLGMPLIGVSDWSNDWQDITAEEVLNNVLNGAGNGGIINCHEPNTSKARTVEALPAMIDGLRAKGYWVMSVGQLQCIREKTLEAGKRYDSF